MAGQTRGDTARDAEEIHVSESEFEAEDVAAAVVDAAVVEGNKQTAERAKQWLIETKSRRGYRAVGDRGERVRIAQAFAARNKVVYGQAFDLVRVEPDAEVDFSDLSALTQAVLGRAEDVVAADATPDDVRLSGSDLLPVFERRAPIRSPRHFEDPWRSLDPSHAQACAKPALS